ncbi:MAG: molecular chaperone DnaJ [Cyanothece sp. SIO2G6]|nr:molecular chaperone DnaJ [Cyanothece sp. SIO2G6]
MYSEERCGDLACATFGKVNTTERQQSLVRVQYHGRMPVFIITCLPWFLAFYLPFCRVHTPKIRAPMVHPRFSAQWLENYADPFAIMGLSVLADDRRTLKRYRTIAKLLHPDSLMLSSDQERENATQFLARLVNPAYRKLKQHKGRAEELATLRFVVRQRMDTVEPTTAWGRSLLKTPIVQVEAVYEQAIAELCEQQYSPLEAFESTTAALAELNLIYLRLKIGEPMVREKRFGVVPPAPQKEIEIAVKPVEPGSKPPSYAQRHYTRAEEYLSKGNLQQAINELKGAIKLESDQSKYHALLAKAYLMQKMRGAAKAYCRRALNLDPKNMLALRCAKYLKLEHPANELNWQTPVGKSQRNHPLASRKAEPTVSFLGRLGK